MEEQDIEKADVAVTQGIVVKWTSVKSVDIDDVVDAAFIKKIKSWSYSRIPVTGKSQGAHVKNPGMLILIV